MNSDPRIMRWMVPDPAGQYWSPYLSMGNNWVKSVDPDGKFSSEAGARIYNFLHGNKGYVVGGEGHWNVNFLDDAGGINCVTAFRGGGWDNFSTLIKDWDYTDLYPVAGSLGLNINISALFGTLDSTPATGGIIFRGPDKGKFFSYTDAGGGISNGGIPGISQGAGVSVSGEVTAFLYLGDINNFTRQTFNGSRIEVNASTSVAPGVVAGGGLMYTSDIHGGILLGIKGTLGLGAGTTVNFNKGGTAIHQNNY